MDLQKKLVHKDGLQLKDMLLFIKSGDIFVYSDKFEECPIMCEDQCIHVQQYAKELKDKYPYFEYDWINGFNVKTISWDISGFICDIFKLDLDNKLNDDYPPLIIMSMLFSLPFISFDKQKLDENIDKVLSEL